MTGHTPALPDLKEIAARAIADRARLQMLNAELLEALIQARTDYLRLDAAYEEAVFDLGVSTDRSRETARLEIARMDAAIAKATRETA